MTDDDDTPDYRLNSSNASKDEETRDFVFSLRRPRSGKSDRTIRGHVR